MRVVLADHIPSVSSRSPLVMRFLVAHGGGEYKVCSIPAGTRVTENLIRALIRENEIRGRPLENDEVDLIIEEAGDD
mgnify:CR=1 FL=1